jgi:tetratricopeptide (TPR) repeat protein
MHRTPSRNGRPLRALALAFSFLSGTAPICAPSAAQAAGSDDTLAAGLKKFDEGRKAFEGGQFEEALNNFKASLELLPSPNTRLYMGRCYRAIGRTASAYTAFRLAGREAQDRQAASGEKRYAATRDAANQEAAELEAKVPRLTVSVPSSPPAGFVVRVRDKELPQAAWGVAAETDPGAIVVEATGPRLVPFKKTMTLAEGAQVRVDVPLSRVPTATLAVRLRTLPSGLELTLDGLPLQVAGAEKPRDLDVGSHTLAADAPGYLPFKWNKSLANNEAQVIEVALAPNPRALGGGPSGTPKWVFFAVAGAAVVSLGMGAGIALNAENQQNQQLALDSYSRSASVKSSIQTQATITDILFVAGGVLGAGAVVLAFTTRWKTEAGGTQAVSVAPWFAASSGGIGAHGAF